MRPVRWIRIIVGLPLLGAVAGVVIAVAILQGRFNPWHNLGLPPEPPVSVTVGSGSVWITTANGAAYVATKYSDCVPDCWAVEPDPANIGRGIFAPQPRENCGWAPPALFARQSWVTCEQGLTSIITVVALHADGSLWYWVNNGFGEYGFVLVPIGAWYGLLAGLTAAALVLGYLSGARPEIKPLRTARRLAFLLALPVASALVGLGLGQADQAGWFEQWQPLGEPPETPVALVGAVDGVWAIGWTGQWYFSTWHTDCAPECWTARESTDPTFGEPFEECHPLPDLHDVRASATRCDLYSAIYVTVYAVRSDGSVWVWRHLKSRNLRQPSHDNYFVFGFAGGALLLLVIHVARRLLRRARPTAPPS